MTPRLPWRVAREHRPLSQWSWALSAQFGSALLLTVSIGCATAPSPRQVTLPQPFTSNGVYVEVDGLYRVGPTVVGIGGVATNQTETDLQACLVSFEVLDGYGVKVADALAGTQTLRAGRSWRFQAGFTAAYDPSFVSIVPDRVQVVAMLSGAGHSHAEGADLKLPPIQTIAGLRVEVLGTYQFGGVIAGITGKITNASDAPAGAILVEFSVFDHDGSKIADAITSTQHLGAGVSWNFRATFTSPFDARFDSVGEARVSRF